MHGHSHGGGLTQDGKSVGGRALRFTILLNLIIPVCQIIGGVAAGSMAVVSDAVHNFSDCAGLILAYGAMKIGKKAPSPVYSFGFRRAEILAALINAAMLAGACLFLLAEAIGRLRHPEPVSGALVVVLAGAGLLGNGLSVLLLRKGAKGDINMRGAFLHMLGDFLTSAAVLINGLILMRWPVYWLDPLLTVVIVVFIVKSGWGVAREGLRIVMEGAPPGVDLSDMRKAIMDTAGVVEAHHLHAWAVGPQGVFFSCHIRTRDDRLSDTAAVAARIKAMLHDRFGVEHATLEFEAAACGETGLLCPREND